MKSKIFTQNIFLLGRYQEMATKTAKSIVDMPLYITHSFEFPNRVLKAEQIQIKNNLWDY